MKASSSEGVEVTRAGGTSHSLKGFTPPLEAVREGVVEAEDAVRLPADGAEVVEFWVVEMAEEAEARAKGPGGRKA